MNKKGTVIESLSLLIGVISLFTSGLYLLFTSGFIQFTFLESFSQEKVLLFFVILTLINSIALIISTIGRISLGGLFGGKN